MDPILAIVLVFVAVALAAVVVAGAFLLRRGGGLGELSARISQIGEQHVVAQDKLSARLQEQERALSAMLDKRLGEVTGKVGESLRKQSVESAKTMGDLKARLATINAAQENITRLSQQVVSLQDVLANKQTRGAFGEVQLEDQVRDAWPPSAYSFQAKLGNGRIVDCLLGLPNPPGPIAIDAKFPLEGYRALRAANNDDERNIARKKLGADVLKHITDIAERYILPGETADSALMFVPSEAVYAELHAELPAIVDKSHRARVYIVSPTTLMATLNTLRAVLRDTQMREHAGLILAEVGKMTQDIARLDSRVESLDRHFGLAEKDLREIRTSADKVSKRATRIEEMDLDEEAASQDAIEKSAAPKLTLATVDGEGE
ncbi:MAG: DNA recombination protein RmuC [Alphaproteobacteria bacterium]